LFEEEDATEGEDDGRLFERARLMISKNDETT
jgi:hypothetical protein